MILQEDLNSLSQWAHKWQMIFNVSKCVHLTITRKLSPFPSTYSICNHTIQQVASAKYLGITLTNNLSWSEHITKITNKANSTRAFLQRNLSQFQRSVSAPVITSMLDLHSSMPRLSGHHTYYLTSTGLKWFNVDQLGLYIMILQELQVSLLC